MTSYATAVLLAVSLGSADSPLARPQTGSVVTPIRPAPVWMSFPFEVQGCWPTGSLLGAQGTRQRVIAFSRASTQTCGSLTCQVDELCVTASGASNNTNYAITATIPWSGAIDVTSWCVCVNAEATGRSWSSASLAIWSMGTNGAANTAQLLALNTGILDARVYDASGVVRQSNSYVHGYADGSAHKIAVCSDKGSLGVYSDGSLVASKATGGTGLITSWPSTFYIGKRSTGLEWIGGMKGVRIVASPDHALCGAGF